MKNIFYCISYYDGSLDILKYINNNYIIYDKSEEGLKINSTQIIKRKNLGYNIDSYFDYIINNYENLPEVVLFCKNNIFPRHIDKDYFIEISKLNVFTPIHNTTNLKKINFPISFISNDNSYLELNNSWYTKKYKTKYFNNYNEFYHFIFDSKFTPLYLNFSPGANYIVPKEYILRRSKTFYQNLQFLITHSQYSCESHFVERSLITIWNSTIRESERMKTKLNNYNFNYPKANNLFINVIIKSWNKILLTILSLINKLILR